MPYPVISRHALLVGACGLIPIPLIDLLLRRLLLRRAYQGLGEKMGRPLPPASIRHLLRERGSLLVGCLWAGFMWPIKKLFRTVVVVLLVKDYFDWASEAAMRCLMVHRALERGLLPERSPEVSAAMDVVLKDRAGSPVSRFITRREHPVPPWQEGPRLESTFVRELVRYGGGHDVMRIFEDSLDRILDTPPAPAGE